MLSDYRNKHHELFIRAKIGNSNVQLRELVKHIYKLKHFKEILYFVRRSNGIENIFLNTLLNKSSLPRNVYNMFLVL